MPFDGMNFEQDDQILRTLIRADELLSDESRWVKGFAYVVNGARYAARGPIPPAPRNVEAMCILGAMDIASGSTRDAHYKILGVGADWNDASKRTFADVKNLFARAIARRRAEIMETV